MSTESARYREKYFWIDSGVAEVWLLTLSEKFLSDNNEAWLIEFKNDIDEMVPANWITGLVQFDYLITSDDRKNIFEQIVIKNNDYLKKFVNDHANEKFLKIDFNGEYYSAYRPFIIPQINRIYDLIYDPSKIINNGEQYSDEIGWFIA